MSAKLIQALTDDHPDLQKQIGCMTGIFQLFDRHHIITGKRINGHSHKKISSGHSHLNNGNLGTDETACSPQAIVEKSLSKNQIENQRISVESSRASCSSSSCSSSFSSLDCNRTAQPEPPSFDRATLERSLRNPQKSKNSDVESRPNSAYAQPGRESLDLRDVVKDSIYREARGLSVRTSTREEPANHVLKHRDSPRPLQLSKSMDGGSYAHGINGKSRMPMDLNESLRVLAKLKEAPWNFNDVREPPRGSCETKDGSLFSVSKDAPRFSFDSRETCKSSAKLRELPRLSLDSRERSMSVTNVGSKSNSILKELRSNFDQKNSSSLSPQQESGTQKRPPSVVAKLMGLEAMPNSSSNGQGQIGWMKTCSDEDRDISYTEKNSNGYLRSSKMANESKQDRSSQSPRSSFKDPISPRRRSPDPVMKPISSTRFPIETAPWRQQDCGRSPQKTAVRSREAHTRPPTSQSVYSEIEKRLKELEFQQSDKDLRALKQILEAMQAKGLLETKKEDQDSHISVPKNYNNLNLIAIDHNPRSANRRNPPQINRPRSPSIKGSSPPRAFESPIVIMKPAKLINRSGIPASSVIPLDSLSGLRSFQRNDSVDSKRVSANTRTAKDTTPKANLRESGARVLGSIDKKTNGKIEENVSQKPQMRSVHASSRSQLPTKDNNGSSTRNSGSVSPRLLQKKFDSEKRSRPPIPPSDSGKPRRQQPIRQQPESGSPGGRQRPKPVHAQQNEDQMSEISSETRKSNQGDEISLRSDSNISLASQVDIEVTSADQSAEMNCVFFQQGNRSPSQKAVNTTVSSLKQKKSSPILGEDGMSAEFTTTAPEQPSPVSVLDASFYRDDLLPSPVKKISNAFKDDENRDSDDISGEDGWNMVGPDLSNGTKSNFSSEIDHKKLENIELLVQKLRRLNSAHDEATTDHIASLCEDANPDHRYISEILLASGLLLKDLSSGQTPIQLHPSGHPISPDLFYVLEQTKTSWLLKADPTCENTLRSKPNKEKLHRKLMFDAINEILVRKLALVGPQSEPWIRSDKLTVATPSGQRLLRELCSEIDQLQAADSLESSLDEDDDGLKSILREDVMCRGESWMDFHKEVPGVVLDVERSIFKDLVDEIVNGEASNLRARPTRRRRQLFAK
ncbi:protein LONGIFOLIA 1-like [Magnolia sinica]|uniref:protein LONGIFOLIA 1-like n=1 Tax=Magnolia sinica TaxID=86752 RepID=UPI00265905A8|nr:protein LONGIFOLIA 1-like [Magnolia sinica]XP_058080306.1 protein LONGIFOLIA 1-like [Magnolia sinica]XP_058080307.1 protein LONGIFOLIA 1-like [Magnolia sinica]